MVSEPRSCVTVSTNTGPTCRIKSYTFEKYYHVIKAGTLLASSILHSDESCALFTTAKTVLQLLQAKRSQYNMYLVL
jgi:hypothetical protein